MDLARGYSWPAPALEHQADVWTGYKWSREGEVMSVDEGSGVAQEGEERACDRPGGSPSPAVPGRLVPAPRPASWASRALPPLWPGWQGALSCPRPGGTGSWAAGGMGCGPSSHL